MDSFIHLATLDSSFTADAACSLLETAGISVMLEHVHLVSGSQKSPGYRLLVPEEFSQRARLLVEMAESLLTQGGLSRSIGRRPSSEWLIRHQLQAA